MKLFFLLQPIILNSVYSLVDQVLEVEVVDDFYCEQEKKIFQMLLMMVVLVLSGLTPIG